MPQTPPQLSSGPIAAPAAGGESDLGSRARSFRPLVAVLSALVLLLVACSSSSATAVTVGSKTIDDSTVKSELATIANNKTIKAKAVVNGKLQPGVVAAWLTMLVESEVARQANEKVGTKVKPVDTTAGDHWANGYFGDAATFAAFPAGFRKAVVARYSNIPAYVRAHTKPPTAAQVRKAYDDSLLRNCPSGRYVSHILVKTQAEAQSAAAQVAAGTSFKMVASKTSTDLDSAPRGGALGCIDSRQLDPTFMAAAGAVPMGQVSAPVQTKYGWHVIQVLNVATALPFDSVKTEIQTDLIELGPEGSSKLQKLMATAKINVAKQYGTWKVTAGQGRVELPTSATSTTTRPPSSPLTTTTSKP
jgi:hypothetical protein